MQEVSSYILDPDTGAILCAACYEQTGTAYEMAISETHYGYACDETANGHFLPHRFVEHET
jgi:hypothetical protein